MANDQIEHVLVLNSGSSSLKWTVLEAESERIVGQGSSSWHDADPSRHADEVRAAMRTAPAFDAVGHRVVHGGAAFHEAVVIDAQVRDTIAGLIPLAPLHNPAALAGIDAVTAAYPKLPQVAAFDTAFHATIPEPAARYAVPREWTERWGLRRFGFHGLSVMYSTRRAAELLGATPERMVVCHLGAGCSVTAVAAGRSADTSMGFTPMEGTMMATRAGSIDPGLLLYLLTHGGLSADDLDVALNERSGLLGVSGVSADLREVQKAIDAGSPVAALAYAMFVHSVVRMVGAMIAVLGGLDALVFTAGIGEHSVSVRRDVAQSLGYSGLRLDATRNEAASGDGDIAAADSTVRALVIAAREDLAILAEVRRLLRA